MCRRCGEGSYRASRSATLNQAALAGKSCLDQVEPFVHTSESAVHLAVQAVTYTRDEMCQFLEFGIHALLESTVRDFGSGSGSVLPPVILDSCASKSWPNARLPARGLDCSIPLTAPSRRRFSCRWARRLRSKASHSAISPAISTLESFSPIRIICSCVLARN